MRRILASLLAAGLLAAVMVVPATARVRPSFTITFCTFTTGDYTGEGLYTVTWANEMPSSTKDLLMTITFRGKKLSDALDPLDWPVGQVFDNVFTNGFALPFPDAPDWNSFTSVTVKATGAFRDSATVKRPAGGWAGPVPGQTTSNCT
jgi:hypothetical protein